MRTLLGLVPIRIAAMNVVILFHLAEEASGNYSQLAEESWSGTGTTLRMLVCTRYGSAFGDTTDHVDSKAVDPVEILVPIFIDFSAGEENLPLGLPRSIWKGGA